MAEKKQYIGITLGPISRIMSYTQSTKSLWGASYFMSYLAKQLVSDLFKKKRLFLKPLLTERMWEIKDGVGRFPDQYIFESQEGDFDELLKVRETVLANLGHEIAITLKKEECKVVDYLRHIIKIYLYEMNEYEVNKEAVNAVEVSEDKNKCNKPKSIVEQGQEALSAMECRDCYPVRESYNYLADYFENIHKSSVLIADAFGNQQLNSRERLFPTIIERSAIEAVKAGRLKNDEFFKPEKVNELPVSYKYIAFVSADGDNISKAIAKLGNKISDMLLAYNQEIVAKVNEGNGQVIYAGGDDLLFFAPIGSIFTMIADIDKLFNEKISSSQEILAALKKENLTIPTLSFGVSISYHKHPMSESVQLSSDLLEEAKETGRNRIVWNMRKHSGQSICSSFNKQHAEIFEDAIKLIENYKQKDNSFFLHSFSHYLLQHQEVLVHILSQNTTDRINTELESYITNTFQDEEHQKYDNDLQQFRQFLQDVANVEADKKEAVSKLHALLRFIELLISKKDESV